ncbi:ABC transporter substrate-binding protein [Pseudodesulfovibrio sp. F-1]|uniref:ABC transporter substrate-binding protein n=1 Tax=Pseudodesulfovibrio alkaliphilus TaxID=2661613 RepID=A0A7K1KJJ9_9BACT|nr:ABC transporter substrate-binding protein [Pseudodesulfovibrio alkaliphilus]MUM76263.1 ABC transporter substrate-binding protein [Pseudodesulfovibrio alkaliphilus]
MKVCSWSARTLAFMALFVVLALNPVLAAGPPKTLQKVKVVMVGDRLVDVAWKLGIAPTGMVSRLSLWSKGREVALVAQALGCANKVTVMAPASLSTFMKKTGVTRVIVEKYTPTCLYKDIDFGKIPDLVKDVPGATVEYVDFDSGLDSAVADIAAKFGKEERGKELISAYEENMKQAETALPGKPLGKRVVVLSGTYSSSTGKTFVNVEAPGGYSDQFFLSRLGCVNAAAPMIPDPSAVSKGHASTPRLHGLKQANPDVIVMVGNAFAVQKALQGALVRDPGLADVPAIKNRAVFTLPFYVAADLLDYPDFLRQWTLALQD